MIVTLSRIEGGYRVKIKYTEVDIDYFDLPKNADCHGVIDALYRLEDKINQSWRLMF